MSAKPLDCANPVCGSKLDLFSKALRASSSSASAAEEAPRACPVDRDELGRATWALLHTTAAYFPETPSAADRAGASDLVRGLAASYPCEHCRADFRVAVAAAPPDLSSRAAFAAWACRQSARRRPPPPLTSRRDPVRRHNVVNAKLGKVIFDCDAASLDRRWRVGAPGCWPAGDATAAESLGRD